MRILILNHNIRERGTYFRAWPIARGMAALGHEVIFSTVSPNRLYRTTVEKRDGVLVYETPKWVWPALEPDEGWGPLGIIERSRIALTQKFDWVYPFAHSPNCHFPSLLSKLRGARMAVDWCDDYGEGIFPQRERLRAAVTVKAPRRWIVQRFIEKHEARTEKRILRRAERVTVISEILRQKAIAAGVAPGNVALVPSGGDLKTFFPMPQAQSRQSLNLPPDSPLISYVANYHPDEPFLMEVLRLVFDAMPSARMAYAGPKFCHPAMGQPPLSERVIHLGYLRSEQIPAAIASGDLALMPMDDTAHNRARCPQKLMDYLACGRPIVTSDVGEVGRIFKSYPQIGVASMPTVDAFAQAIVEVLQAPQSRREEMGLAARKAAVEEFNWERAVRQVEAFLS